MFLVELTGGNPGERGSIWHFKVGEPRNFEQAKAKTRTHKTVRKHTEPAFIEPMQCKPVTVLPTGEKWTFESNSMVIAALP
jgi:hypothetical protein